MVIKILITPQETIVRWHSSNKKYYQNLGYEFTKMKDAFCVNVCDLPAQSHAEVFVRCDFCNRILKVKFQNYSNKGVLSDGYACTNCKHIKAKESNINKYGVDNVFKLDFVKEKSKITNMKKYGVDSYTKLESAKLNNAVKTTLTFYKNGTCPTSSQQIKIHDMLNNIYGNCLLNYPCGRCNLDCYTMVNNINIDIEYDGTYWHKDEQKDRRRDEYIKSCGYKIFRIKSNRKIPNIYQLIDGINRLVYTEHSYYEITL